MTNLVCLVPIYKANLEPLEQFSLDHSLTTLAGVPLLFIAPEGLDTSFYSERYGGKVRFFDPHCFSSVHNYSRLLMSESFYNSFLNYEFMLILQPDVFVFRNDLAYWVERPFDYIGAPWPDGFELRVNLGKFDGPLGKLVKAQVGNGGFSLRRTQKCLNLIREFPEAATVFTKTGSNEDLFFSVMGSLSNDFVIPNEITASCFATELKPEYYYQVNNGRLPMGTHAWWRCNLEFWKRHLPPLPVIL